MYSLYVCVRCDRRFVTIHYDEAIAATGRTVEHCGEPARWVKNLDEPEARQLDDYHAMRNGMRKRK